MGGLNGPPFFLHMTDTDLKKSIIGLAAPLAAAQGLEIWGLEIVDGPRLAVRLFVDVPNPSEEGVHSADISQCEEISRQLELAMDVGNIIDRPWVLEVSSPGLERVFFYIDQMRPYVGDLVEARLFEPLGDTGRKNWRGELAVVNGASFVLKPCSVVPDGDVVFENVPDCEIPWEKIRRVRRLHVFKAPAKPGKKRKPA